MDIVKSILTCLGENRQAKSHNAGEVTNDVVAILWSAEQHGESLKKKLDGAVSSLGWSNWLAENVLKKLEAMLNGGHENMGPAMKNAYDDAMEAAEDTFEKLFQQARDHPMEMAAVMLLTILAFGVLVALAPYILELLGFSELGPVAESFAAWWESTYGGYIPAGSLFSFFQRLGMVWARG